MRFLFFIILAVLAATSAPHAQQIADTTFSPPITKPEYAFGEGPIISLDEAHHNFHTLDGRYRAFGELLTRDGYEVRKGIEPFSVSSLRGTKILVIANAIAENDSWKLPTRSAFTADEVEAVTHWVANGGSLLLIADHMPFAGAAAELASAFGFELYNGFAMRQGDEIFTNEQGNLHPCPIINGRDDAERVAQIRIFTGQGFRPPANAIVFTSLGSEYKIRMPEEAWVFTSTTPEISGEGLAQGAYLKVGNGRVVMVAEAAMFSAQLAGPQRQKMGMNHPTAKDNPQLLLNIIHWLDGRFD